MAFDPTTGVEGRVRIGGGDTVVAGIQEWRINKQCAEIPFIHFECSADADSVVWASYERGIASATITLRGFYDVGTTPGPTESGAGIKVGATVSLDLFFSRTPFGYSNVGGFVSQFEGGTNVEQSGTFSATVRCTGTVAVAA
jgi:hypothetical protein